MANGGPRGSADLEAFVVELGAAMTGAGESVYSVQERLTRVTVAYGAASARISAFPTFMMVTMGRGEPAVIEITSSVAAEPRLDQIAALDRLVIEAERGEVVPSDGLERLDQMRAMRPQFGRAQSIAGYSVFALGLCLILHPAAADAASAAVLGAVVGLLRTLGREQSPLRVLMPVLAAFAVSSISALAVKYDVVDPGLRAIVSSLVVFLPGATLTTAVLELAAGQVVSGASRLVSGAMQLALLAFGIVAGIEVTDVAPALVYSGSGDLLGSWAPWLGVLVFAAGVVVANSAPARSLPGLLVVLYAAWAGQVVGNALLGGYLSAFVGALVMTPTALWASRLPSAMPQHASFLPGFWLLVPGALGLVGLARVAGDASAAGLQDLVNTVVSIYAVALGVLTGTLLLGWAAATGRVVGEVTDLANRGPWLRRLRIRPGGRAANHEGGHAG